MTQRHYTLTETLSVVDDLDAEQLDRYIRAGVVVPVQSATGTAVSRAGSGAPESGGRPDRGLSP